MRFLAVAVALAALVKAQNSTVQVQVGGTESQSGGIYQFIPNNLNATNGSVITFVFSGNPGNHSITQSNFSSPCEPMSGGFDSGWVNIPAGGVSPNPTWNLTITNTSIPIWFFCKQLSPAPHCPVGMVGAINAPPSGANTFTNYLNNAKKASTSGQGIGDLVGNGASASALPAPLPSGAELAGTPSGAGSATGSATGSSASTSASTSSSAGYIAQSDSLWVLLAALMGITLV